MKYLILFENYIFLLNTMMQYYIKVIKWLKYN